MKNSKENIISDLKIKINEFKSRIKNNKLNCSEEDNNNIQINLSTLKNFYKAQNVDNLDNNQNSINQILNNKSNLINNNIQYREKGEKIRSNSSSTNNFMKNKNYLDFDIDEIIKNNKNSKKEKIINQNTNSKSIKSKTFVNFDDLKINKNINNSKLTNYIKNNSNKKFIELNLSSKKSEHSSMPHTDRNNNYTNKEKNYYEENFSEPNIIINNTNHNYFQLQSKLSDFMNEIKLSNKNYKNSLIKPKPSIKNDKYKYNLNFLNDTSNNKENYFSNKKSVNKYHRNNFNLKDLLSEKSHNNNDRRERFSSNNRKIISLYKNSKLDFHKNLGNNNNNLMMNLNNKTLSNFNFNYSNKNNLNLYDNNINSIYKDILQLKYNIQNLSNEDINNFPISVYKEIKELYNLLYIKFFKNN